MDCESGEGGDDGARAAAISGNAKKNNKQEAADKTERDAKFIVKYPYNLNKCAFLLLIITTDTILLMVFRTRFWFLLTILLNIISITDLMIFAVIIIHANPHTLAEMPNKIHGIIHQTIALIITTIIGLR